MKTFENEKNHYAENIFEFQDTNFQIDPDYGWGPCHEGAQELAKLYDKSKTFLFSLH